MCWLCFGVVFAFYAFPCFPADETRLHRELSRRRAFLRAFLRNFDKMTRLIVLPSPISNTSDTSADTPEDTSNEEPGWRGA